MLFCNVRTTVCVGSCFTRAWISAGFVTAILTAVATGEHGPWVAGGADVEEAGADVAISEADVDADAYSIPAAPVSATSAAAAATALSECDSAPLPPIRTILTQLPPYCNFFFQGLRNNPPLFSHLSLHFPLYSPVVFPFLFPLRSPLLFHLLFPLHPPKRSPFSVEPTDSWWQRRSGEDVPRVLHVTRGAGFRYSVEADSAAVAMVAVEGSVSVTESDPNG
ncbi:unnamed protein product [Closterium sp. Naga37s-1]|nr:unnamed protein product [Closterium sp. Naga37s-1]